jgi:hypothetical protein
MTEHNIFCWAKDCNDSDSFQQKRYRVFNKEVGEKRYYEIVDLIKSDILKGLKLELDKESWSDEWKKVSKEQWRRILAIPESDKTIIENVIGFKLDLEETLIGQEVKVEVGKKTYTAKIISED